MSRAMADGLLHDLKTLDARQDPAGANLAMRDAAQLLDGLALNHLQERTEEAHQDWMDRRIYHQEPVMQSFDGWRLREWTEEASETGRYRLAMAFLAGMGMGAVCCLGAAIAVGLSS